jgi:hypothetical protein
LELFVWEWTWVLVLGHIFTMSGEVWGSTVENELRFAKFWGRQDVPSPEGLPQRATQPHKQEDCKFNASLGYVARPCLQKEKKKLVEWL